jgi:hypothetical protein
MQKRVLVHPYRACIEGSGHPGGLTRVVGEDGRGEAVRGVVGEFDGFCLGGEFGGDDDGAEDLYGVSMLGCVAMRDRRSLGRWRSGRSCSCEHEMRVDVRDSETYLFLHHLHLRTRIRQHSRFDPVPAIALRPFLTARH